MLKIGAFQESHTKNQNVLVLEPRVLVDIPGEMVAEVSRVVERSTAVAEKRRRCPMAVIFRDGSDRNTVVRTACTRVSSSSSPVSHRALAPATSGAIYRSSTNHLQIHAAWSDRGVVAADDNWTPYILEYACTSNHITYHYSEP